jgi:hypothetical protein
VVCERGACFAGPTWRAIRLDNSAVIYPLRAVSALWLAAGRIMSCFNLDVLPVSACLEQECDSMDFRAGHFAPLCILAVLNILKYFIQEDTDVRPAG